MTPRPPTAAWWFVALSLALPKHARAGAFPQPDGQGQIITEFSGYQADIRGYDAQGRPSGRGTYRQFELAPYVEYGLSDRWTIGAQPRLQDVRSAGASSDGLAELNLFARYLVWRGESDVLSVQGTWGTPGVADHLAPQVANPNSEYELRLLGGHSFSFGSMTGFLEADAALRARAVSPADETHIDLAAGLRPRPDCLLLAQSFTTIGLRDNRLGGANYDVTKLQLSVVYTFAPRWSVQIGGYTEVAGRNVALGNAGLVALWYSF